jgi:hypothetical protein
MLRAVGRLRSEASTASSGPPSTDLAAWFAKSTGISSSGGAVSAWADQSGNARDLVQATGANQPALQGDGTILFNGTAHFLKTAAFTLNQPCSIYLRFKQVTWTANDRVFDGNASGSALMVQSGSSPALALFAGTGTVPSTSALAVDTWGSIAAVFNGASSVIQVSGQAAATANSGAGNPGGLTLGANGAGAQFGNIQVAGVVVYAAAHDATQRAAVFTYLDAL